MDYGAFLGVTTGVQGLITILSKYPHANVAIANAQASCVVEVWYDNRTNTITLA